jgi:nucleoid-associated protein YejK
MPSVVLEAAAQVRSFSGTLDQDGIDFQEERLENLVKDLQEVINAISKKRVFTLAAENSSLKQVNTQLSQGVDDLLTSELTAQGTLEQTLASHVTEMEAFLVQLPPVLAPPLSPTLAS